MSIVAFHVSDWYSIIIMVKFSNKSKPVITLKLDDKDTMDDKDLNGDKIFDPPAEMMIHDFDDERTLEEEEALENSEDPQTELSNLQREGDMPLEELLAMYGYGGTSGSEDAASNPETKEEKDVEEPLEEPEEQQEETEETEEEEAPSELVKLYEDIPETVGGSSRLLRSVSRPQSETEEDDYDYSPDEEEWKKTIMVGSDYQAKIPVGLCKYDDALPYENDDKMLWDPTLLTNQQIEEYLIRVQDTGSSTNTHVKDDEQALYLLLQCGYNVEEALRRRRISSIPNPDVMSIWSEEECRNFETGMRMYGKDFHTIQKNKVRTRSVGELVQFYYLWKKTERHDVYAHKSKLEKKKYILHPGITDYMDRFLEEQEFFHEGSKKSEKAESAQVSDPLGQFDKENRLKVVKATPPSEAPGQPSSAVSSQEAPVKENVEE